MVAFPEPVDFATLRVGDMPGDKVEINDTHLAKARSIFPRLWELLTPVLAGSKHHRAVISVHGGSGVGKSETGALLAYGLNALGVGAYVLSGDNYPRRIPEQNDAERLRVYTEGGQQALDDYLGSPAEIDFDQLNAILAAFHDGAASLSLKRMGRRADELWHDDVDVTGVQVIVLEWTHGNSPYLHGVDLPILLNSTRRRPWSIAAPGLAMARWTHPSPHWCFSWSRQSCRRPPLERRSSWRSRGSCCLRLRTAG